MVTAICSLIFTVCTLAHFDKWRNIAGYPKIEAWDPGTEIQTGVDINHTSRGVDESNPYIPVPLPTWFQHHPRSQGNESRVIIFVRSFEGQDETTCRSSTCWTWRSTNRVCWSSSITTIHLPT